MIDLSEVKKIADLAKAYKITVHEDAPMNPDDVILAFAQAIYAMCAAEQKEKDAKICMDEKHWHWHPRKFAEAIRSQE